MAKRIGITTTVPHEIIVAAGAVPVDLNNLFISDPDCGGLVDRAEAEGFPAGVCSWIKGLYAAARAHQIDTVVAVINGDCANTRALAEVLIHRGLQVAPFMYPAEREPVLVAKALEDFARRMGTTLERAERVRRAWWPIRQRLVELDTMAWEEDKITSRELHQWLVSASDFNGDPEAYDRDLKKFLIQARRRSPLPQRIRLAYLGVPPILNNLFEILAERGARVAFTEIQRQFAMPNPCADLIEQFCRYTYPYSLEPRLSDVIPQIRKRRVVGAINYVQAFCHRQIEHIVLREKIPVPILALEADRPGPVTGQTLTRLDAFLEMLR